MFTELAREILLAQSVFHLSSIKTGNRVLLVSLNEKGEITTVAKLSKLYKDLELNKNIPIKGHKDIKVRLNKKVDNLIFYRKNKTKCEYVYYSAIPMEEDDCSRFFLGLLQKIQKVAEMILQEVFNY